MTHSYLDCQGIHLCLSREEKQQRGRRIAVSGRSYVDTAQQTPGALNTTRMTTHTSHSHGTTRD